MDTHLWIGGLLSFTLQQLALENRDHSRKSCAQDQQILQVVCLYSNEYNPIDNSVMNYN